MFLPPGAVYPQPRGGGGSKWEQRGQGWTRWQEEEEQVREIQSCSSFCLKILLHHVISGKTLICPCSRCAVCKKKLGLTGFTCRYFDSSLLPQRKQPTFEVKSYFSLSQLLSLDLCRRCGGLFCSIHRYSDKHQCDFDYKVTPETPAIISLSKITSQINLAI